MMLFVTDAQLGDERPDRLEDRVERVAVAREDHPGGECARSLAIEGVECPVDHFAGIRLVSAGTTDGFSDADGNSIGNRSGKLSLQSGRRPEMMEKVGMGAADLRGDGLESHGLRTLFEQQQPRRLQGDGTALFGVKAFSAY